MARKQIACSSRPRILRREDSLSSRQYHGVCVRVIYECDALEVLRTDMDPGTVLDNRDVGNLTVLHIVVGGSPVFLVANQKNDLMPGDSIALPKGQPCRVSNPASSRSSILSFVFRGSSSRRSANGFA